ncbi:hypothetical protein Tco_0645725, partial [Tanacetum coccineum]
MDLEQNNSLAKLPLLKQGEYDTWRLRIESYIQLQDYSLWEIIEEGNSFKPVAQTTREADGTSTTTIPGAVTVEEKILKKQDLKARSILMMTLPSEHLLTFNKHKDAESLFEAIEARFGGNKATKKTQKTLLKLQKIMSQLTILGEIITPEELTLKFLRSLPTEWDVEPESQKKGVTSISKLSSQKFGLCLRGLASVEERLVFYKKNESMLNDQIAILKRDASYKDSDINGLEKQVKRLKKEKEENQFKIDNYENASKSLEQLIANQISDNNKKGLGYNVVPPPLTGLFAPPSVDLSSLGIEKFKEPEFEGYGVKDQTVLALAIPGQTATGKESSNPFMAGSLPKTISPMIHLSQKIMAASAITISSDSSDESVGSPPSRVILFGDIPTVIPSTSMVAPETSTIAPVISSAAPVVETTLVASPTGLCGLVPYLGSHSDSPDEVSSPEHISPLPAISPFLCTDSSEAPDSSDGPPSQDPYVATVARWRSRSMILIRPREAIPFGRPYRTHLNWPRKLLTARKRVGPLPAHRLECRHASPCSSDHHSSSSSSSLNSLPVHSSGLDASDQAYSGSSTRDVPPRLCDPPRRAPR